MLEEDQQRLLLQEYFGEVTPKNYARLRLMTPMSEIHEAMWGTTQTGISKLDEDFQGYADLFFGRVRERFTDFRWECWLKMWLQSRRLQQRRRLPRARRTSCRATTSVRMSAPHGVGGATVSPFDFAHVLPYHLENYIRHGVLRRRPRR